MKMILWKASLRFPGMEKFKRIVLQVFKHFSLFWKVPETINLLPDSTDFPDASKR